MLPVAWQKINLAKYNSNQHRKAKGGGGGTVDDNQPVPAHMNHDATTMYGAGMTMADEDAGSIKTLDAVMEEPFGSGADSG